MRWFFLKVGSGNSLAVEWLAGNNPLKRPAVPIFFGRCSIADIRKDQRNSQAKDFYESGLPKNRNKVGIIVVGHGRVWFLRPAGELSEHDPSTKGNQSPDTWKILPVELILPPLRLSEVPPVLAGINANAYLSRGTYRELSHWGNIKAIYSCLKMPLPTDHLKDENCEAPQLLECLSSVELETLVAKLFESVGCFVSAYRGGCIEDADLFVHNDSSKTIKLDSLVVLPGKGLSVQVKSWGRYKKCPEEVDCLIGFEVVSAFNCFDGDWLLRQVKSSPKTLAWLMRSLRWLPPEFLSKYGL